jgi:hypothetical protein
MSELAAQSVDWLSAGLRLQLGVHRKWSSDCQTGALDPGRVKTFFVLQELHAAGRDPRRRDHLSIFWLYRLWSQSGRNLGPR